MNRSRTKQHGSQNSTAEHYQRKIKKRAKILENMICHYLFYLTEIMIHHNKLYIHNILYTINWFCECHKRKIYWPIKITQLCPKQTFSVRTTLTISKATFSQFFSFQKHNK